MAEATQEDAFTYYEGNDRSVFLAKGYTYTDENLVIVEDGYTYVAGVVFFTFLIP